MLTPATASGVTAISQASFCFLLYLCSIAMNESMKTRMYAACDTSCPQCVTFRERGSKQERKWTREYWQPIVRLL